MENNYNVKEDLIAQVEELLKSEDAPGAYARAKVLSRKWRKAREYEESLYDKELSDKFHALMDELSEKAGDIAVSVEDRKNDIIARAKEVAAGNNYKKGTDMMKQLLDEWKLSGRLDKEKDDELWNQFLEARNEFFTKKKEYYTNLKETFAGNKKLKEELIEKAKEVANIENIKEASNRANELMEEWKKTGTAGRKDDDNLWQQFLAERKAFFARRDEYYDNLKETFAQRTEAKKELINEAKLYLARGEFTDEEVDAIKELRNKWKEVGNAGKDHENDLWNEFNTIINKYFENMRYYKD
ncbi:MAG: DUF349 domain-containing protein [Erysipelotrichaceae bacterium]|nr:DUF349 domain-containing protein [Erysipelotrichaceae bacterium]